MKIAGIQKLTLVDFPGHVAATIFTRGCTFRCPFCHNPELVIPEQFSPLLSEDQIFNFLESRYGKLTGVCLTGGEPTMHEDCDKFISHLKALGFDMKLDTNGSNPEMLAKIIADGDIDYIAMDIKSSLEKYTSVTSIQNSKFKIQNEGDHSVAGLSNSSTTTQFNNKIMQSIKMIMDSGIDYEFRTTVCHPLHEVKDFFEIGEMIRGAKRYFIQNFVKSKHIDSREDFKPFSSSEIKETVNIMTQFVKEVSAR